MPSDERTAWFFLDGDEWGIKIIAEGYVWVYKDLDEIFPLLLHTVFGVCGVRVSVEGWRKMAWKKSFLGMGDA